MTPKLARTAACVIAALVVLGRIARAQELRGTVRDSASNVTIAGAVVTLLDATGRSTTRTLTNERGDYRLHVQTGADRLRIVHIGFRPRDLTLPHVASADDTLRLDVLMARLPTLGIEFARDGFLGPSADGQDVLFAPDAETLLDDDFVSSYCFRLIQPDAARTHQLGLGFSPPDRKADRVDIDGALWIDTLTRTLHDIEFRYIGLDSRIQRFGSRGQISFGETPNGVVLIDRWNLRLVGSRPDSTMTISIGGIDTRPRLAFFAQEAGAELARVAWPTGHPWQAPLGVLHLNGVTSRGAPAADVLLRIPGTPYGGRIDTSGIVEMRELVPGPYELVVVDPRLATIGIEIPSGLKIVAVRDSTLRITHRIPTAEEYATGRCDAEQRHRPNDTTLIVGRALTPSGEPLKDAEWAAFTPDSPGETGAVMWTPIRLGGTTGSDGVFQLCTDQIAVHQSLRITVRHDGYRATERILQLKDPLTVLRFALEPSSR